jgi:hypothetical protein
LEDITFLLSLERYFGRMAKMRVAAWRRKRHAGDKGGVDGLHWAFDYIFE